jgi:hypothetical protein
MEDTSQVSIHGRMRQRIVAVGQIHTNRIIPLRSRKHICKDKYLHAMLQSGAITPDQLDRAIRGYNKMPSEFAWMSDVDDAVLYKADRVFSAQYDRFPTDDTDFRLNGNYHRICRSLQHDWYYYDHQSERLHSDYKDKPSVHQTEQAELLEEVRIILQSQGDIWDFGLILVGGFVSAPILGIIIVMAFPGRVAGATFLFGAVWLALLVGGLVLTLPRQSERKLKIHRCSKCGGQISSEYVPEQCPYCRAPFRL